METSKDKQEIISYLEHESSKWVRLRDRCERTACLDSNLLNNRDMAMERIDYLLEELFVHNVMLELESSHEMAV